MTYGFRDSTTALRPKEDILSFGAEVR